MASVTKPQGLLSIADSVLLLVDIQEKFRPVVPGIDTVIRNAAIFVRSAVRLQIPVLVSEQYPKGLGATVAELKQLLPMEQTYHSKACFSAAACTSFAAELKASGRKQVVLVGVETHVCILQTGLELLNSGYALFVAADSVSSRKDQDRNLALSRLERQGAVLVSTEMVVFEWLREAGSPVFKELQALFK